MQKDNVFIVCDRNVRYLAEPLAPGRPILEITADENHKNMDSILAICRWLLELGAGRDAVVYAVGGGVTTDMVGFAASIYKRGVKYVNYPTTLLSQVDAGIGGKTGVNLDGYKNILGVTRFPIETRIITDALKTLPKRELLSGAAELLKTFIIEDKGRYERAVELLSAQEWDLTELTPLIKEAGDVKRRIVEKDPYEEGLRRVLNLGHSYAHAIEWYEHSGVECAAPLSHGEAVAVGIIRAAVISEQRGLAQKGLAEKLRADFRRCGLPTELPYPEECLSSAIWKDKKVEGNAIHFVLIKKIGEVVVKDLCKGDFYTHGNTV